MVVAKNHWNASNTQRVKSSYILEFNKESTELGSIQPSRTGISSKQNRTQFMELHTEGKFSGIITRATMGMPPPVNLPHWIMVNIKKDNARHGEFSLEEKRMWGLTGHEIGEAKNTYEQQDDPLLGLVHQIAHRLHPRAHPFSAIGRRNWTSPIGTREEENTSNMAPRWEKKGRKRRSWTKKASETVVS